MVAAIVLVVGLWLLSQYVLNPLDRQPGSLAANQRRIAQTCPIGRGEYRTRLLGDGGGTACLSLHPLLAECDGGDSLCRVMDMISAMQQDRTGEGAFEGLACSQK